MSGVRELRTWGVQDRFEAIEECEWQMVDRADYDAIQKQLSEHEEKGLAVYGRKIELLNLSLRKLAKEVEMLRAQRDSCVIAFYGLEPAVYKEEIRQADLEITEAIKGVK